MPICRLYVNITDAAVVSIIAYDIFLCPSDRLISAS